MPGQFLLPLFNILPEKSIIFLLKRISPYEVISPINGHRAETKAYRILFTAVDGDFIVDFVSECNRIICKLPRKS